MTDVATKMGAGYSKKINGVNSISLDEFGLFSRIIDFNGTHSLKADKLPESCLPRKIETDTELNHWELVG